METIKYVLKKCPLHFVEREVLRKVPPELDTKKGPGAVIKFLDSLPQLLYVTIWCKPLAHGYFHGKFGAIERLNLLRALTPLLCQSHRDKCFWNFMSSLYIVLFCKFYVTIWCKDNKLIIYLSTLPQLLYVTIWCKPLAHGYFHGKFGAIERLNLLRALTPLLCQSHRDKCFWNFMSSLYIVLFCNFM